MVNFFIFFDIFSAFSVFILGYSTFLKDSRRDENRIFFILTLFLTILSASSAGMRISGFRPGLPLREILGTLSPEQIEKIELFNEIGWIGISFIPSVLFHLCLEFLKKREILKSKIHLIPYLCSTFFLGWVFLLGERTYPLFYPIFSVFFIIVLFFPIILSWKKFFKLKGGREKARVFYFALGFSIPFFGATIFDVLIPLFKFHEFVGTTYSLYFVILGCLLISIGVFRYRLFVNYREILETIFKGLSELVVLLDKDGLILLTNETTSLKLGVEKEELAGKKIHPFLKEGRGKWEKMVRRLQRTKILEEKLSFLTKEGREIPFLLAASQTKEGIILVGKDIGELVEYQERLEKEVKERTRELEETKNVLEIKVAARTRELRELAQSLEEQVKSRTKELQLKLEELERFQKIAVGRELKMVELKKEVGKLKRKLEGKE